MKKIFLLGVLAFTSICVFANNATEIQDNRKSARKIATALGACTLPDGSMGKMTVVEKEYTTTNSTQNSYSNSGSVNSSINSSIGITNASVGASAGASSGYNSTQQSRGENSYKVKEECRQIQTW